MDTVQRLTIGEAITRARKARKWTREQLAVMVGASFASVRSWERGDHFPGFDQVEKLARVFDWKLDFLENPEGDGNPAMKELPPWLAHLMPDNTVEIRQEHALFAGPLVLTSERRSA